jgi:hypothetical protein
VRQIDATDSPPRHICERASLHRLIAERVWRLVVRQGWVRLRPRSLTSRAFRVS